MGDKEFEKLKEEKMKEFRESMAQAAENIDKAFEEADNLEIEQYFKKFKHYVRSKEVQEEYESCRKYSKNEEERDFFIGNRASLETYDIIMAEKGIDNKEDLFKLLESDLKAKEEYETIKSEITQLEIKRANKYQERNKHKEKEKQKQINKKRQNKCQKRYFRYVE